MTGEANEVGGDDATTSGGDVHPGVAGEPGAVGAATVEQLADVEAIRQLKHTYFRLLDLKRFDELGRLFVEDATTAYDSGNLSQRGRGAIVEFLQRSLGGRGVVTMHHGHHPCIALHGDGTATGSWYLEDRVIVPAADLVISGTAFYSDEYVKVDGTWKIRHTGYERVVEEHRTHSTGASIVYRTRFDPPDG